MSTNGRHDGRSAGRTPRPSPTEATFSRPDCGHRSRFDGDWSVAEGGGGRRYPCPDCGTEITVRPARTTRNAGGG